MKVSVTLTAYAWHALLRELEYAQRFVNRDTTSAENLWREISSQLNSEDPHQQPTQPNTP